MTDILTRLAALTQKDGNVLMPCPFCKSPPMKVGPFERHCCCRNDACIIRSITCPINEWNTRPREAALIALVQEAAQEIQRLKLREEELLIEGAFSNLEAP
jgi:hypothetical protein